MEHPENSRLTTVSVDLVHCTRYTVEQTATYKSQQFYTFTQKHKKNKK